MTIFFPVDFSKEIEEGTKLAPSCCLVLSHAITAVSDFVTGAGKKNEGESKNEMGIGLYYTFADFLNIRSMPNGFRSWTR